MKELECSIKGEHLDILPSTKAHFEEGNEV
jgi:hypothetical protein